MSEAHADVPGVEVGAGEEARGKDRSNDVVGRGDRKHVLLSHHPCLREAGAK